MAITTQGKYMVADAVIGGTTFSKLNTTTGYMIVGDSATAFNLANDNSNATWTAGANVTRKLLTSSSHNAAGVITAVTTFATGDANFAWNCWGLVNNVTPGSGQCFNRVVESLGTKTSAQTWVFTATITVV